MDGKTLLAFIYVAHDLGINVERLREGNDLVGYLWADVYLHAMTHVEHLLHFTPVGA